MRQSWTAATLVLVKFCPSENFRSVPAEGPLGVLFPNCALFKNVHDEHLLIFPGQRSPFKVPILQGVFHTECPQLRFKRCKPI